MPLVRQTCTSVLERLRVCVCVPPSVSRSLFYQEEAGACGPLVLTTRNEAVDKRGKRSLISSVYLHCSQIVTPMFLRFAFMVVLHAIPQNRFPSR